MDIRIAFQNQSKNTAERSDPADGFILVMNALLEKYLAGSKFAGLEIQLTAEGKRMHLVVLRRKRKEASIEKQVSGIETYEELSTHLSKEIPLVIQITGKGVLYRRLAADPGADPGKLLAKVFPNASLKDFCIETLPAAEDEIFISVLRRSVAAELGSELIARGFSLVGAGIGSPAVTEILSLFGGPKPEMAFGNHFIRFKNEMPAEVIYDENPDAKEAWETGGQKVESSCLIAFAAAFGQIVPVRRSAPRIMIENSWRPDFLQQQLFKKGRAVLLAVAFLILLINFLFFSYYRDQNAALANKLEMNGGAFRELAGLEKQVSEKRKFLSASGLAGPSHHAFYADRLAAGLPEEIVLTEMEISPRIRLADEDSIGFSPGEILLAGTCSESIILNSWMQALKKETWIKNATLEKYIQDKTMSRGEFHILLNLE